MSIIKCLLVTCILFLIFFLYGYLLKVLLKRKKDDLFNKIVNGFILTIAIFELLTLPFSLFKLDIKILYYISLSVYLILTVVSLGLFIYFEFIKKEFKNKLNKLKNSIEDIKNKKISKKHIIIIAIIIMIIGSQIVLSTYLNEENADDSFYVSWSEETKQLENYLDSDPSLGQENSIFPKAYILNSWEIFNGFLAKTFNIEVTVLTHSIYIMTFITISYMTYYMLLKKIDKKNSNYMLLILAFIFLFSGVSPRFRGYTLLVRIWQGKTILTNIFIPYVLYLMTDMHIKRNKIIMLIIANIASIAFNPISIWIFPFIYMFFTIIMIVKKRIKDMFKMIIVIIPFVLVLPIYLMTAINGESGTVTVTNYVTYIETLKNFISSGIGFVILYILSFVYILFKGNRRAKRIFCIIPIIEFITLLNPLIAQYVQKYVTASVTYWRIFWLIPLELTICYFSVDIINRVKNIYLKAIITIIILVTIFFVGANMYTESGQFTKHVNSQKIPQYIIDETNYILNNSKDKVLVIAPTEPLHGATMRQLSSNIILFYSRPMYAEKMENSEEKSKVYSEIYSGETENAIKEAFDKYMVDYIILNNSMKNTLSNIDTDTIKKVYEDDFNFILANCNSKKINL